LSAVLLGLDCFDAVRVAPLHNSRPDKEASPRGDYGDFFAGCLTARSDNRRYTGATHVYSSWSTGADHVTTWRWCRSSPRAA